MLCVSLIPTPLIPYSYLPQSSISERFVIFASFFFSITCLCCCACHWDTNNCQQLVKEFLRKIPELLEGKLPTQFKETIGHRVMVKLGLRSLLDKEDDEDEWEKEEGN